MKQIIDYLWNASPWEALTSIAIGVCVVLWLIGLIRPSSSGH